MIPAGTRLYRAKATDANNLVFTLALVLCALEGTVITAPSRYLASATVVSEPLRSKASARAFRYVSGP